MKEGVLINGTEVKVDIRKTNFKEQGYDFEGSEYLVYFANDGKVFVDKYADKEYVKYSAIHEAICQGEYKDLAPKCSNPNCRCFEIDKMLIGMMPYKERGEYAMKRIKMFSLLLEKNMNPALNDVFKESLEGLKKM